MLHPAMLQPLLGQAAEGVGDDGQGWLGFLWSRFIDGSGFLTSVAYQQQSLSWNEVDFYLQVKHVHANTLTNMREDLRDMHEMYLGKINNQLVIATLMISIGFGFTVEGTFPPSDRDATRAEPADYQNVGRVAYAAVLALSLVLPFWSILCYFEVRRRLDHFIRLFNQTYHSTLQRNTHRAVHEMKHMDSLVESPALRHTSGLPHALPRRVRQYFAQARDFLRACAGGDPFLAADGSSTNPDGESLSESAGPQAASGRDRRRRPYLQIPPQKETLLILNVHQDYVRWRDRWCIHILSCADNCLWLGVLCMISVCGLLLGMWFEYHYRDTPTMWKTYVVILIAALLVAVILKCVSAYSGPRATIQRWKSEKGVRFRDDDDSLRREKGEAWSEAMEEFFPELLPDRRLLDDVPDWALVEGFHPELTRQLGDQSARVPSVPRSRSQSLGNGPQSRKLRRHTTF